MFVLSDLTRFKDSDDVCVAFLDMATCECYRPLPYLTTDYIYQNGIFPGKILEADVLTYGEKQKPHVEDCSIENEFFLESMEETDFKSILERSCVDSINKGFGTHSCKNNSYVDASCPSANSILTVKADPLSLELEVTDLNTLRLKFADAAGDEFTNMPIADLLFHSEAKKYVESDRMDVLEAILAGGDDLYIRIGLGRMCQDFSNCKGYQLQVNGVYSFPGCFL